VPAPHKTRGEHEKEAVTVTSIRESGVPTQDGAEGVVAEMWEQVLDQIPDEDKPVEEHDVDAVGHIFDGDEDERSPHSDVTAWDDHDVDGLTAEEAAMHYVNTDDDDPEADPDLTPEVRRELEEF
jgi:hypothetical protein